MTPWWFFCFVDQWSVRPDVPATKLLLSQHLGFLWHFSIQIQICQNRFDLATSPPWRFPSDKHATTGSNKKTGQIDGMLHDKSVHCWCRLYGLHIDTTIRPHIGTVYPDVCFAGSQPWFQFCLRGRHDDPNAKRVRAWCNRLEHDFCTFCHEASFWIAKHVTHFYPIVLAILISDVLMPIGIFKSLVFDPPRPPCAIRAAPKWHAPQRERFGMVPQAPICRHEWNGFPRPGSNETWWVKNKKNVTRKIF